MNLVIDAGNTLTKVAVFNGTEMLEKHIFNMCTAHEVENLYNKYSIDSVIVSDVKGSIDPLYDTLRKRSSLLKMSSTTPTPLTSVYKSPDTLGSDRFAAAVFGSSAFPGLPTLTIQAGTCITYEFTTAQGCYMGGAISPGLEMRFAALHNFTARLPLVKKEEIDFLIGTTTKESILSGVINGCAAETDGIIDQYREQFPSLEVVFGGGDIIFFDKRLKNRIFATANLVLKGLNIILEHNK